ncbi:hypothetical protein SCATT_36430 [Streptantibioticus cattleyicolor NRRL 8057 = DSM 46488]|uniref:Uncharacterized protein n=1 Tax=Streptantibioticus cattleyicolor (strain ATCC 35852 / DSM 46488 / JCM 4925 / NBRC 14057 / NRRL 8057) TaxID=1003195 RepID=G8X023_STREN|nr:hypothetical protein SCATT_36430 [Streptantibioticus cattleyicolor NRRL 8057 = DSM 46488]
MVAADPFAFPFPAPALRGSRPAAGREWPDGAAVRGRAPAQWAP